MTKPQPGKRPKARCKATEQLLAAVEAQFGKGSVEQTKGSNHFQVKVPGGIVTLANTPSDHRSVKNARSRLRRLGVEL